MYIEREVAIEKTEAFCDVFVTKWTDEKVIAWIKNLPTAADVAPVVYSEWGNAYYDEDEREFVRDCLACGKPHRELSPFCPNCGAKMIKE